MKFYGNISFIVGVALEIATKAHKGQVDKAGVDYIKHPLKVASMVTSETAKIVALLHDVIDDSEYTLEDLKNSGFTEDLNNSYILP